MIMIMAALSPQSAASTMKMNRVIVAAAADHAVSVAIFYSQLQALVSR
jgi:hypothetical protein